MWDVGEFENICYDVGWGFQNKNAGPLKVLSAARPPVRSPSGGPAGAGAWQAEEERFLLSRLRGSLFQWVRPRLRVGSPPGQVNLIQVSSSTSFIRGYVLWSSR